MANRTIEIDYSEFEFVKEALHHLPRDAHAAMANALNRTVTKTVGYTHDEVSRKYAVKRKGVKETLSIQKAKQSNLVAVVESRDRRLKISHFPFSAKGKNRIANVEIVRGRKVLSTSNPPLFVGRANGSSGKREVFTRPTDGSKYKVTYGFTMAIPQMIENEEVWDKIAKQSKEFLRDRFYHEMEQRLARAAAKK